MSSVPFFRFLSNFFTRLSAKDKKLKKAVTAIMGASPFNLNLYKLATLHSSVNRENKVGKKESNERLEYLGDAVIDLVIADNLFKKFPFKDEGFLTEIRSRIVNRESLNRLATKIGIDNITQYDSSIKSSRSPKSIYGNTLEAVIGAIYLDRGYSFCKKFILRKLIIPHFDLDDIVKHDPNNKSRIIEWAQKENHAIRFELLGIKETRNHKEFTVEIYIDNKPIRKGFGYNKKKAEQDAAQKSCEILNIE